MRSIAIVGLIALAGCVADEPEPQALNYSAMSRCELVAEAINSDYSDSKTLAVAMEVGRANGCFN